MNFQKYGIGQVQYVDLEKLVIQFHDGLTQDPILTQEKVCNQVKTPESLLNQEVKMNCQVEVQDHIHSQVQSQKRDNLSKCQCGFQNFDVGQV